MLSVFWSIFCIDVGLYFVRIFNAKNVWQITPILLLSIVLKVQIIVNPVILIIRGIVPHFKISRSMLFASSSVIPPISSLSLLKSILFKCSSFHVTVFKRSLIWSTTCVCWCNNIVKALGEII